MISTFEALEGSITWWLGIGITGSQGTISPRCPAHSLDTVGHHVLTCKHGGVAIHHNRLQDVFAVCISVQVEVGCGLGTNKQPADVPAANWMMDTSTAFDFTD